MIVAYTIPEARKIMGIGTTRIYEEISAQRLRAKKAGKRTLIPADAIEEWLKNLPDFPARNTSKKQGA